MPESRDADKPNKQFEYREFTLTAGRSLQGTVIRSGPRRFTALSGDGQWLGVFSGVREAMRCISAARGGRDA